MPEAIVPKVGHRPKMGQYGFDRACFSVVFLFLLCFIAHLYEANGGTDMEVLACFRPGFYCGGTPPSWSVNAVVGHFTAWVEWSLPE